LKQTEHDFTCIESVNSELTSPGNTDGIDRRPSETPFRFSSFIYFSNFAFLLLFHTLW